VGILTSYDLGHSEAATIDRQFLVTRLAKVYIKEHRYEEAIRILDEILNVGAENRDARLTIAAACIGAGHLDRAQRELQSLLARNPEDGEARYHLGELFEKKHMNAEAMTAYDQVPRDSSFYGSAQVRIGHVLGALGRNAEAIRRVKDVLAANSNDMALYRLLASLHETEGRIIEAEEVLKQGLARAPENTDLRYHLGVLYFKMERPDDGIHEMEIILKFAPDSPEALNYIGYSWVDRGIRLGEAEAMIKKALRIRPNDGSITDSLGWLYFKQHRLDDAIRVLKTAATLRPDDPAIADHLGDAYKEAGMHKEALEQYEKVLRHMTPWATDQSLSLPDLSVPDRSRGFILGATATDNDTIR
jgi:tetratricopeptide (TPR) repeat protein